MLNLSLKLSLNLSLETPKMRPMLQFLLIFFFLNICKLIIKKSHGTAPTAVTVKFDFAIVFQVLLSDFDVDVNMIWP